MVNLAIYFFLVRIRAEPAPTWFSAFMNSCVREGQEGHPFLGLSRVTSQNKAFCVLFIVYCVMFIVYCTFVYCLFFILCSVLCILFTESLKTIKVYVYIGRGICHAALD